MIDAALGHKDLALDEGRRIALMPVEKDVVNGSYVFNISASRRVGGREGVSLQQVETGLRAPCVSQMLSYGALKLLPFWDPLRGDPRFEKIVDVPERVMLFNDCDEWEEVDVGGGGGGACATHRLPGNGRARVST